MATDARTVKDLLARVVAGRQGRVRVAGTRTRRLADMRPGERGAIAQLDAGDPLRLKKLLALGLVPGCSIELVRRAPAYVFRLGYSQFAVDEPLAAAVTVLVEP